MVGGYVTVNSIAGDFFQPNNGIVASLKSWLSFATMDNEAVAQILSSKLSPPKYDFTPCFTFAEKRSLPSPISNLTSEDPGFYWLQVLQHITRKPTDRCASLDLLPPKLQRRGLVF